MRAGAWQSRCYLKSPKARRPAPGSAADLKRLAAPMTRRALARQRRAEFAPAVAAIRRFARARGLTVRKVDYARRRVVLAGSARPHRERLFGLDAHV